MSENSRRTHRLSGFSDLSFCKELCNFLFVFEADIDLFGLVDGDTVGCKLQNEGAALGLVGVAVFYHFLAENLPISLRAKE